MKFFSALILFVALTLASVYTVNAQAAETFWIQTNTAYKTKETVTVTINGISATPIQGFTAQIRYDPSCLQPVNGTSPISGMNGLAVPQQSGLADVSFASTTPQMANGLLAELRFTALKGCQTSLNIESAALVIRSESGLAVPISGITINQSPIVLNIDSAEGSPQPELSGESVLPLVPTNSPESKPVNWTVVGWLSLAGVLILLIMGLFKFMNPSQ
jgi:hypothetical protein